MSFGPKDNVPPLPLDMARVWESCEHLTPKEFGLVVVLLAELWQAPGNRIRPDFHRIARFFSNGATADTLIDPETGANGLDAMFWFHEREGYLYSPYILELVGRPTPRMPIPRWMKEIALERALSRGSARSKCQYCFDQIETGGIQFDHVLPISRGGINHPQNLVVACGECNRRKGAMTGREFNALLDREAYQKAQEADE